MSHIFNEFSCSLCSSVSESLLSSPPPYEGEGNVRWPEQVASSGNVGCALNWVDIDSSVLTGSLINCMFIILCGLLFIQHQSVGTRHHIDLIDNNIECAMYTHHHKHTRANAYETAMGPHVHFTTLRWWPLKSNTQTNNDASPDIYEPHTEQCWTRALKLHTWNNTLHLLSLIIK